ncbi:hypothetical protein [Botrimarina sp.]|uniref:hypothetical protein n=1 Tax=Botrimarina sp. TaxID=2795802 RepID=UPI0032EDE8CE
MLHHAAAPTSAPMLRTPIAGVGRQGTGTAVVVPTYMPCECSTCGRKLRVRLRNLGRAVECPSCHREFVVRQMDGRNSLSAMDRAERLLARLDAARIG